MKKKKSVLEFILDKNYTLTLKWVYYSKVYFRRLSVDIKTSLLIFIAIFALEFTLKRSSINAEIGLLF